MTKQEEIREGIALRLHTRDRVWLRILDETNPRNCMWEDLPFYLKLEYRDEATILSDYLRSQGVVIKAERELPSMECEEPNGDNLKLGIWYGASKQIQLFERAGYVAVEPLIKEDKVNGRRNQEFKVSDKGFNKCKRN